LGFARSGLFLRARLDGANQFEIIGELFISAQRPWITLMVRRRESAVSGRCFASPGEPCRPAPLSLSREEEGLFSGAKREADEAPPPFAKVKS
jgi:hypothetical protein